MNQSSDSHEIEIEVDGHVAASAQVSGTGDPDFVRSAMHVESGNLPAGTRARLVDAVLDDPQVQAASHLAACMPTSDTEMLARVRERTGTVEVRAMGSTKLVDAELLHE